MYGQRVDRKEGGERMHNPLNSAPQELEEINTSRDGSPSSRGSCRDSSPQSTREPESSDTGRPNSWRRPRRSSLSFVRSHSQHSQPPARVAPLSRDSNGGRLLSRASSRGQAALLNHTSSSGFLQWYSSVDLRRDKPLDSTASLRTRVSCFPLMVVVISVVFFLVAGCMLNSNLTNNGQIALLGHPNSTTCTPVTPSGGGDCTTYEYASIQAAAMIQLEQQLSLELSDLVELAEAVCVSAVQSNSSTCATCASMMTTTGLALEIATLVSITTTTLTCQLPTNTAPCSPIVLGYRDQWSSCVLQVAVCGSVSSISILETASTTTTSLVGVVQVLQNIISSTQTAPQYPLVEWESVKSTIMQIQFWPEPLLSNAQWPQDLVMGDVLAAMGLCVICFLWLVLLFYSCHSVTSAARQVSGSVSALLEVTKFLSNDCSDAPPSPVNPPLGPARRLVAPSPPAAVGDSRPKSTSGVLRSAASTPVTGTGVNRAVSFMVPQLGASRSPVPAAVVPRKDPADAIAFTEATEIYRAVKTARTTIDDVASYVPMAFMGRSPESAPWGGAFDFFGHGDVSGLQTLDIDDHRDRSLIVFDVNQTEEAADLRSACASPQTLYSPEPNNHPNRRDSSMGRIPSPTVDAPADDNDGDDLRAVAQAATASLLSGSQSRRRKTSFTSAKSNEMEHGPTLVIDPPAATSTDSSPPQLQVQTRSFLGVPGPSSPSHFSSLRRASALAFVAPSYEPDGSPVNVNPMNGSLRQKLCTVLHCHLIIPSLRGPRYDVLPNEFELGIVQLTSHSFHEAAVRIAGLFDAIVVSLDIDYVCFAWNGFTPYQFHETRACQCALHIEQALRGISETTESWKLCAASFAMCVATGQSIVGSVSVSDTLYPVLAGENTVLSRHGSELATILGCATLVLEDTYAVAKGQTFCIPRDTIGNGLNQTVVFELKAAATAEREHHIEYIAAFSKLRQGYFQEAAKALKMLIAHSNDDEPAYLYALKMCEYCVENPGDVLMLNQQGGSAMTSRGRPTIFRRLPTWLIHEKQAMEFFSDTDDEDSISLDSSAGITATEEGRFSVEEPSTEPRRRGPASDVSGSPFQRDPRNLRSSRHQTEEDLLRLNTTEQTSECDTTAAEANTVVVNGERWTRGDRILGSGASGTVRLAMSSEGSLAALKSIPLASLGDDAQRALSEVSILSSLRHPCIVSYISSEVVGSELVVLMEYCGGGTLHRLINLFGALPLSIVQRYARDILKGLNFLHKHGVTHRDLSLNNILVSIDGVCKLSDFGASIARSSQRLMSIGNVQGTPAFMAPEACLGQVSMTSDVWSFGIALCWMVSGQPPYDVTLLNKPVDFLRRLASDTEFGPVIPQTVLENPMLLSLVQACLQRSVVERPWAETLLAHPFFLS